MGKVWLNPNGDDILLAFERTQEYGGNHIAIRHYANIFDMIIGHYKDEIHLVRQLAPGSEGTPSFESVHFTGDLKTSMIKILFHYHKNSWND